MKSTSPCPSGLENENFRKRDCLDKIYEIHFTNMFLSLSYKSEIESNRKESLQVKHGCVYSIVE
jgi:hypothetical protein